MRGRIGRLTLFGALAVAMVSLGLASMPSSQRVQAAGRYRIRSERIAQGLTLLRIKDLRGPNRIRVLKLDPDSRFTLDMELATDVIPGHEPTSSMASRNGAIAAVNGDYTLLPADPRAGRPVHTFAQNSELITSPLFYGRNFALTPDEQAVFIGHPTFGASLTQHDTSEVWDIAAWNEVPADFNEFSVYTPAGGYNHKPPRNACSARLYPTTAPALTTDQTSVARSFTVAEARCASQRLARRRGTVVAAPWGSAEGSEIASSLVAGESVTLAWTTGWPGVNETIGGNPSLLENGVVTIGDCPTTSYFCARNPRTGIGVKPNGKILLITVDGRQDSSVGMTLTQFARLFQYLGATSALNLDGGGSTTMWARGEILNKVSDPSERPVGSAILVVPDAPGPLPTPLVTPSPEPTGALSPTPTGTTTEPAIPVQSLAGSDGSSPGPACAALQDPGSTGGLLDYLARTRSQAAGWSPLLRHVLDVYRGRADCTGDLVR